VVLLSGGRDSVCLLDVAVSLRGAGQVQALHINYARRPEADADAAHCRELCEQAGVPYHERSAPRSLDTPGNFQAWARDVRYAQGEELAARHDAWLASAHTATDQVETVLYRLAASPGRRALRAMSPRRGRLVRPLLGLSREQTTAYCAQRGLAWREDSGNRDPAYARARVRAQLLPALRALHPAAEANLLRTAELLRAEGEVLDELVARTLAGREEIGLDALAEVPPALARLVVIRLAEDAAGGSLPGVGGRVPELLELGRRGGEGALDLGGGVRAVVRYGVLAMSTAVSPPPVQETVCLPIPGRVRFGDWELSGALGAPVADPVGLRARDGARPAAQLEFVELLDGSRLTAGLLVRPWRHGDRMAPLGLGGTRSLADLFGDRRVPREERRRRPLVEVAEEIAWVPGVALSERFRVTDPGRPVVCLRARRVAGGGRQ
jgi:tRNA(Ile)-lysidine synthase